MPDGSNYSSDGIKHDAGKPRFDLIPVYPIEELARLYGIGAAKYGDRNWEKGMVWGRIFRAMVGHAWKWWRGERYDQEDGQHHLASVAWCAFALMDYERRGTGRDDRASPYGDQTQPGVDVDVDVDAAIIRGLERDLENLMSRNELRASSNPIGVTWGHHIDTVEWPD